MYDHVLIPIDLGNPGASDKAMSTARQIASDYGAVLHVMTVVPQLDVFASGFFPEGYMSKATETARDQLHQYTRSLNLEGAKIQHVVAHGAIYDQILTMAAEVGADLIVMASHRPELSDYLLGPNSAKVVRHANCSVMIVRP